MKILGLIPARGGSKGVPRKNILPVMGKPLIGYTIETALNCAFLDDVVVSTDDAEIAEVSKTFNAQVIMRPRELATDTSNVVDAALKVIFDLEKKGKYYDVVVLLQPTSPLRKVSDIESAVNRLKNDPATEGIISVVEVGDYHPARMYELENSQMKSFLPEQENERRQDLEKLYIRNGCIYAVRTKVLKQQKTFMPRNKAALVMPAEWAVNIDAPIDLIILKELMKQWKAD